MGLSALRRCCSQITRCLLQFKVLQSLCEQQDRTVCNNRKCSGTKSEPRYRLVIIGADPSLSQSRDESGNIELVLFGPKGEELIGTPIDCLIAADYTGGASLPAHITTLYGKCFEMRLSVSPYSLQVQTSYISELNSSLHRFRLQAQRTSPSLLPASVIHKAEHSESSATTALDSDFQKVPFIGIKASPSQLQASDLSPPTIKLTLQLETDTPSKASDQSPDEIRLTPPLEIASASKSAAATKFTPTLVIASTSKIDANESKKKKCPLQEECQTSKTSAATERTERSAKRRLEPEKSPK